MATPVIAKTSTPDATLGNPISMVTVDQGAGAADQQVITLADPTTAGRFAAITAAGAQVVDGSGVTQPVSGSVSVSNFPATQPISAVSLPLPTGALADATFTGRVNTQGQKAMAASTPVVLASDQSSIPVTQSGPFVIAAGTNRIGSVRLVDSADADLTSAKAAQTSRAVGVQELKDAGRVIKVLSAFKFTPATTEAMVTLTPIVDGVAGTTGTSFAVTAGKRWRISTMVVTIEDSTTTSVGVACYLRINANGAAIVTSPMIGTVAAGLVGTQVARCATSNQTQFTDGLEISGTMQIGISQQGIATADATVVLIGYEY